MIVLGHDDDSGRLFATFWNGMTSVSWVLESLPASRMLEMVTSTRPASRSCQSRAGDSTSFTVAFGRAHLHEVGERSAQVVADGDIRIVQVFPRVEPVRNLLARQGQVAGAPQGMVYPAAFARLTVMDVPVIAMSYLPATTPLIRVFQSVATKLHFDPHVGGELLGRVDLMAAVLLGLRILERHGIEIAGGADLEGPLSRTLCRMDLSSAAALPQTTDATTASVLSHFVIVSSPIS